MPHEDDLWKVSERRALHADGAPKEPKGRAHERTSGRKASGRTEVHTGRGTGRKPAENRKKTRDRSRRGPHTEGVAPRRKETLLTGLPWAEGPVQRSEKEKKGSDSSPEYCSSAT